MSPVLPAVSALYAAVLGLLAAFLTIRVIVGRVRTGIQAADGGNADLGQRIRAHANFAEQVPLALLLIVLADMAGTSALFVHGLGSALVVARVANASGLSGSLGPTTRRQAGAGLTLLVIVAASLLIAWRVLGVAK